MKQANKYFPFIIIILIIFSVCASSCGKVQTDSQEVSNDASYDTDVSDVNTYTSADDLLTNFDKNNSWDDASSAKIDFSSDTVEISGSGASSTDYGVLISSAGDYVLSGEGYGKIVINVSNDDKVRLIFNGLSLYSSNDAAIIVENADKVVLTIEKDTANYISDGTSYSENSVSNGCIFSKDDLTINGEGTLDVKGNFNNGIVCKDDLKIVEGNINVSAVANAIKGKDSVVVASGTISIKECEDGIKAENDVDPSKGYVIISGGTIDIVSSDDAIQAVSLVSISSCSITVEAGDDSINCDGEINVEEGCLLIK